jgi:hypothetical protein
VGARSEFRHFLAKTNAARLLAPFGVFGLIADVLPDRPIKLDQFLVGGGNDATLRGLGQRQNFGELGLQFICHK